MTTIADGNNIVEVEGPIHVHDGVFIMFGGVLREIRDIHKTNTGRQIELIPL